MSVKAYAYTTDTTPSGTPTTTNFGYNSAHPDRLTTFGGKAITYDANGCVKTYDGWTYTWINGKLTKCVRGSILSGMDTYTYTYDAYGRRISKNYKFTKGSQALAVYVTSSSTNYTYDTSGRLIREQYTENLNNFSSNSKDILYLYDESGVIGFIYTLNGTPNNYYYLRNLQGDVIGIYDVFGVKVARYAYDAFGNCTITLDTNGIATANPIRYRGYYYDNETGLYYLNARYYNPEWRRFVSPDDTAYLDPESVNGLNLYAYCNNDPVMYMDRSGHTPEWLGNLLIMGAGALLIAGLAIATFATGGTAAGVAGAVFAGALKGALIGAAIGTIAGGAVGYAIDGVDGIWAGMAIGFTGGAVVGAVIGGTVGGLNYSSLKAASNAANKAIPSKGFNINKHLSSAGGKYNKFNLDSSEDVLRMVQNSLKSQNVAFAPNKHARSWQVIVDMGTQIGTKGQSSVKVILGYGGKIWTMYPI